MSTQAPLNKALTIQNSHTNDYQDKETHYNNGPLEPFEHILLYSYSSKVQHSLLQK